MYVHYPLSLRNVENLQFERGIDIHHEPVRLWPNRFRPMFAGESRRKRVQRMVHCSGVGISPKPSLSRYGIRANCITPSFVVDTPNRRLRAGEFTRKLVERADEMARLGVTRPSDTASFALFLVGPGSTRRTGQAVSVNGGISAA